MTEPWTDEELNEAVATWASGEAARYAAERDARREASSAFAELIDETARRIQSQPRPQIYIGLPPPEINPFEELWRMVEAEAARLYVHDAHCNVIHEAGPKPCPPHCEHDWHVAPIGATHRRCPKCDSVQPMTGGGLTLSGWNGEA